MKGRFGFDFISSEERLTTPLIRKDGWLQPASWDEAIQLVASKLSTIKQDFGSNAMAGFSSAKTTNEDNYAFQNSSVVNLVRTTLITAHVCVTHQV